MRINKNYYSFSFGSYCGVIVDEKTMKKISKLQYETKIKLLEILENSENTQSYSWSISEEPKEVSQGERTFHYIDGNYDTKQRLGLIGEIFDISHIKDLYQVSGGFVDSLNRAKEEHTNHLINLGLEKEA
jgi:hypothetical protein